MTEAEWLACADPAPMQEFLREKAGDQKLRLFAAACCRQIWHLLVDERSQDAVEAAENYKGRRADEIERGIFQNAAIEAARDIAERYRQRNGGQSFDSSTNPLYREAWMYLRAANAATLALSETGEEAARTGSLRAAIAAQLEHADPASDPSRFERTRLAARRSQADLFRDIFGNPFRAATFSPEWRTSTAVALARSMYGSCDFGAIPILADALQDAGCTSEDVLAHCRGGGPHVRGCWVVDLVLGKV